MTGLKSQQQGIALIIALVITTIAVSLASLAMYRQQLQIRLSGNIVNLEQAYEYAVGMEDWSKKILEKDYKDNPNVDSLQEDWATLLPPIPILGGSLNGQLFDLQGRINLNMLIASFPKITQKKVTFGGAADLDKNIFQTKALVYEQVVKLIAKIDTEQTLGPAQNFADTVKDWIDKDDEELQGGAESAFYQSQKIPYMSANSLLKNNSELLLLKGVTKGIIEKLSPLVSSLPKDTKININTAEKEVLEAIGFNQEVIENIKSERDDAPFESMKDFWNLEKVKIFFDPNTDIGKRKKNYEQILSNTSNYFLLQGQVNINNSRIFINSILERKKGKVRVIMRDYSKPSVTTSSTKAASK